MAYGGQYLPEPTEEVMFRLQRQTVLDKSIWAPANGQLRYIEAWSFENENTLTPDTYREGDLNDKDVLDWLRRTGRFAPPSDSRLGKEEGGIRLLLCELRSFMPLAFGLSKASLLAIESEFGLSGEMLPIFFFNGGGYSHHFVPLASRGQKPEKLLITVKVPQMFQVATMPHIWRISELIKSQISNWKHPSLLPAMLLEDHVHKADLFKGFDLSDRVTTLERHLLATKAGRNVDQDASLDFDTVGQNIANNRFEITRSINTAVTDAVSFGCNMKWDSRYCQFLRDISKQLGIFPEIEQDKWGPGVDNGIELLANFVASIMELTEALKARLDIQLDVLYNLVAQVDSNVNSTIAATTGLDSVAMKALAFVTTVFLPPTFIATLFSMSMFDRQSDTSSDPEKDSDEIVVSRHFGIYWVVSVPLTIVVLLSWRTWWHRQKNHYRKKYPHVKMDPDVRLDRLDRLGRMLPKKRVKREEGKELERLA
ncbi:Notoamide biosynthesis cluster protein M' [Curvularia clavata]|uniref:Notoamide biosynthesis cluster protein M n=1 Tax=Curvularia clavata TaxID=95742 RepID=A0A9Q8ZI71_CURCL|nr:Notoamide biosynthesis cluster protein M' [Curvularia clavata]